MVQSPAAVFSKSAPAPRRGKFRRQHNLATSVILVWLPGGLPHMEMYNMKPEAPAEFRGEFRPVRTNVPGIDVCELMPLHTMVADRFSLIRSISHEFALGIDDTHSFLDHSGRPMPILSFGEPIRELI